MNTQTRHWSTPLIIGTSIVVAVSGVMMFFHIGESLVKGAHEWVGIAFFLAIMFHVLNHWKPFKQYFSKKLAVGIMSFSLLFAAGFIVNSSQHYHPLHRVADQLEQSSIGSIALLQNKPVDELKSALVSAGLTLKGDEQTLKVIADTNKTHLFDLIDILFEE